MLKREDLIRRPNYLLGKYQNELFRQLKFYMEKEGLNQKQMASKLGVSDAYISQVLNGNFNFTLKKLLELSLMMDMVPRIQFVPMEDYLKLEKQEPKKVTQVVVRAQVSIFVFDYANEKFRKEGHGSLDANRPVTVNRHLRTTSLASNEIFSPQLSSKSLFCSIN